MMDTIPEYIESAAFEAHMAAADKIAAAMGLEQASLGDVATALAHAYGEALALYAMSGADNDQMAQIGIVCSDAARGMVSRVHVDSCAGSV